MLKLVVGFDKCWLYSKASSEELAKTEADIHERLEKLQVDCRLYELARQFIPSAHAQPLFDIFLTKVRNSNIP
jgi:hypothetical protein